MNPSYRRIRSSQPAALERFAAGQHLAPGRAAGAGRQAQDNLNTHSGGSQYKRYQPAEAIRILNKIEFHSTPKHGAG